MKKTIKDEDEKEKLFWYEIRMGRRGRKKSFATKQKKKKHLKITIDKCVHVNLKNGKKRWKKGKWYKSLLYHFIKEVKNEENAFFSEKQEMKKHFWDEKP